MKIIREDEQGSCVSAFGSPNMLALCLQWKIRRCNYVGCRNMPNTIISGAMHEGNLVPIFGLCEEHFQICNKPGGGNLIIERDDFDAFAMEANHANLN